MEYLRHLNIKHNAEKMVFSVDLNQDTRARLDQVVPGRIPNAPVFLEEGNKDAGLQHIINRHIKEFRTWATADDQEADFRAWAGTADDATLIKEILFGAVINCTIVAVAGTGGAVYRWHGTRTLRIVHGNNGFIVTAHPISLKYDEDGAIDPAANPGVVIVGPYGPLPSAPKPRRLRGVPLSPAEVTELSPETVRAAPGVGAAGEAKPPRMLKGGGDKNKNKLGDDPKDPKDPKDDPTIDPADATTKLDDVLKFAGKAVPLNKFYVFNMTGNILVASTANEPTIQPDVSKIFQQVGVFFSATTAAIARFNAEKKPAVSASLFNVDTWNSVISKSGCFARVTDETLTQDANISSFEMGMDFIKGALTGVLAMGTSGAALPFLSSFVKGMSDEGKVRFSSSSETETHKIGTLVFVCEYLLGMPVISAILAYVEVNKKTWETSFACGKTKHQSQNVKVKKTTYMFVPPQQIQMFSKDLLEITKDPTYDDLVRTLQKMVDPSLSKL